MELFADYIYEREKALLDYDEYGFMAYKMTKKGLYIIDLYSRNGQAIERIKKIMLENKTRRAYGLISKQADNINHVLVECIEHGFKVYDYSADEYMVVYG